MNNLKSAKRTEPGQRHKIVSMEEAVQLIQNGDTVATEGFVGIGFSEGLAIALENRFKKTNTPTDLTLLYAAGQGDGKDRGLNHLAHEGLVKRVVGGHWGLAPKLGKLALENKIEGYNWPQGVISVMFRDIAAGRPRTITHVGLGTFVDPRNGGGKINSKAKEDLVELIEFDGKEYLSYKTFPVNVAIIRGTTGDPDGNISMEKEALYLESLAMAMAARNSGGLVIVQVERLAERGYLRAREIKIPGILVDLVVVAEDPSQHSQTFLNAYNPSYSGELKIPLSELPSMPLDDRKIIARRGAFELYLNQVVNLGIGMPEGVANIAAEEGILEYLTLTAEPGVIGGIPSGGLDFGAATNVTSIIDQPSQFDFYDGGGLDITCLGLAQCDENGDLNVSKFGPKLSGAGGFINISQNSKKVCFLGTFTAGGLKIDVQDGNLKIIQEGKIKKFIKKVEHVTFSGMVAFNNNTPVYYITERCVFKLVEGGIKLIEVAPGIDIEKDILDQMEFKPIIEEDPTPMDTRLFSDEPMGLKEDLITIPLEGRLTYNPEKNLFFIDFEGFSIRTQDDLKAVKKAVIDICQPLDKKVYTIVNYDNFYINPDLLDAYAEVVQYVVDNFYENVTRYSTNAFLRMKLGDELKGRNLTPHLYETRDEAQKALGE
jgi:propionate CoA-transferase